MTSRALLRPRPSVARPDRPQASAEALEERLALAIFTVLTTADIGPGSLRRAVDDANAANSDDTIVFDASFYAAPKLIDINAPLAQFRGGSGGLTIVGPGSSLLTVRKTEFGPAVYRRVFDSFSPRLNLSGMTLTGGNLTGAHGAGISCTSASNVTLDDMVITGNTANTNDGGGIWLSNNATLTIRNSVITNNSARRGGGISYFDGGSLVMDNCTVAGNTAVGASGRGVSGGGVYFAGAPVANPPAGFLPDTLLIRNSTISNNIAAGDGGGFGSENLTGTLLVRNSTISGNTAATSGGGILQVAAPVTITIENSTITNNSAGGTATGTNATGGGGICRVSIYPATLNITNSVVSGNSNPLTPDILTTNVTTNVRYSAIGSPNGFTPSSASGNNRPFGTNPMLGPLADNGGPTQTHALLVGSTLANAGSNALVPSALTTDQRGPGFPRVLGNSVDIGAYERAIPPAIVRVFVGGNAWTPAFKTYLQSNGLGEAAFGYAIPDGADQLKPLPWLAIDRITIRFGQPVTFGAPDLVVTGVNTANYPVNSYNYDPATFTATWTLGQPLRNDKVRLKPTGAADFRINALPGDADRGGTVLATDYAQVKKKFFKNTTSPVTGADSDYSPFHDVDGSGTILATDYAEVKRRFFNGLPGPEPMSSPAIQWVSRLFTADVERLVIDLLA